MIVFCSVPFFIYSVLYSFYSILFYSIVQEIQNLTAGIEHKKEDTVPLKELYL